MKSKLNDLGREFFNNKYDVEKIRIHSECVIEACLNMCKNTNLNKDVFVIAGWIHDIGKKIDNEKHHIHSLDFLIEFLHDNPEFLPIENELKDCIENHRSKGKPETIYGQIFRCADKVALHNKKWIEYKKNR